MLPIVTILLVILITIALAFVYYRLLYVIGKKYEEPVMRFFDKKWKPTYYFHPKPGSRLEMVILGYKEAVVDWKMKEESNEAFKKAFSMGLYYGAWIFFGSVIISFILNPTVIIIQNLFWPLVLGYVVFVLFQAHLLYLPFKYWVLEWERRTTRMVVFTDWVIFVKAKAIPHTLFFPAWLVRRLPVRILDFFHIHEGEDAYMSRNRILMFADEPMAATDPSELSAKPTNMSDLEFKHILGLSKSVGLGNVKWPSRYFGSTDFTWYVAWHRELLNRIIAIADQGKKVFQRRELLEKAESETLIGKPDTLWNEASARRNARDMHDRGNRVLKVFHTDPVECFSVSDPGLYDPKGNPTSEDVLNYEVGMAAEDQGSQVPSYLIDD